jgi:hypothetical protein
MEAIALPVLIVHFRHAGFNEITYFDEFNALMFMTPRDFIPA